MNVVVKLMHWHKTHRVIITVIIITILVGGASGVIGELLTRGWLLKMVSDNQQLTELNNQFYNLLSKYQLISTGTNQPLEIVIRQTQNVTGLQVITRVVGGGVIETARQGTVNFYPARTTTATDPLTAAYQADDQLGQGIIITNDGWIVTTRQVLTKLTGQVVVTAKGDTYSVEKIVTDPLTEFVFVKVAGANLPVVSLAKTVPTLGSGCFTLVGARGLVTTIVTDQHLRLSSRPASNTERFDEYVRMADLSVTTAGAPVFDEQGIAQGLTVTIDGKLVVRPLAIVNTQVEQVLKNGQIDRLALGIDYIQLDQLSFPPSVSFPYQQLRRGALVYRNTRLNIAGIAVDSSAANAEIQVGDVILKVDGVEVNSNQSLTDLIQTYRAGDNMILTIWRDGSERTISVTIQSLKK